MTSRVARKLIFVRLSGLLFFSLTPVVSAQTSWNAQSGDWFQPANWSDGVPTAASDGTINNGGTAQILSGTANARTLGLGGGPDELLNKGTLVVSGPGALQVEGDLGLANFGIGTLMILNGGVVNSATSSIAGSTHFGGLPGVGTVEGTGSSWNITAELYVMGLLSIQDGAAASSGSLTVDGGVVLDGAGSSLTTGFIVVAAQTNGSLSVSNGAVLTSTDLSLIGDGPFVGGVTVDGPGSRWDTDAPNTALIIGSSSLGFLNVTGGAVVSTFATELAFYPGDNGHLMVDGAGSELDVLSSLSIGGSDGINGATPGGVGLVQIRNGGSISSPKTTIFGQGMVIDDGTLASETVGLLPGGVLSGTGSVAGLVDNGGVVAPGDPLGTLTLDSLTQDGTIRFAINGRTAGAQAHLSLTGDASILGGTVEVRFNQGFLPAQGDVFELIDVAGTVSGAFEQVTFPDLRAGFQFSAQFVNGLYQVTALNDGAPAAGLLNISTRAQAGQDDAVMIAGFIVNGTTEKKVLIRGIGPSLVFNGTPLVGRLADPTLELHDGAGAVLTSNDNWRDSPERQQIIDSGLAPTDELESAIETSLAPGNYTAVLHGADNGTGIAVVEVYDLGPDLSSHLANISTRGFVGTDDDVMIGGFISDDQNTNILIRALGPSLEFVGVNGALADPSLELHNGNGDLIASNNDWQETNEAPIRNTGLAPSLEAEAAIFTTLGPGAFTAIVRGQNETSGIALLEVYNLR